MNGVRIFQTECGPVDRSHRHSCIRLELADELFRPRLAKQPTIGDSSNSGEPFGRRRGIMGMTLSGTHSDGELIRLAQAGDQRAFRSLAQLHSEPLLRCAITFTRDRQLAEDIVQETLLEAWRSIGRFDGRCRFSTWLYGILRHRYLKATRRLSRVGMMGVSLEDVPSLLQSSDDPLRDSQRSEDAAHIRQVVAALPDEHRQVIELRFFADLTLDDISASLDVPLGTVKSRLHNGLEKLRQQKIALNLFATPGESPTRQP